jgi:iron uptake system component EfeO
VRTLVLLVGFVAIATGCGSSSKSSDPGGSNSQPTIKMTITSDGCQPATITAKPGSTKFEVANDGAAAIDELEVKSGEKIVGEAEGLAPGLSKDFTVNLKAGTYEVECPGGKSATLTVTG